MTVSSVSVSAPNSALMTLEQARVVRALAAAHFHQWACECAEATAGLLDINEIKRAVRADLAERYVEWEGVVAPVLDADGCAVHRTGEGRGRLSWQIAASGETRICVYRPIPEDEEGHVVLAASLFWGTGSKKWLAHVEVREGAYHERHVEAFMSAIASTGLLEAEEIERVRDVVRCAVAQESVHAGEVGSNESV